MTNKIRKSRILAEVYETVKGLQRAGVISKRRMHEYDALGHLDVADLGAGKITLIREKSNLSQAVLNASVSTVKKWETGEK